MFLAWSDDDQDKALAWSFDQSTRCGGCGHPLEESTDEANERAYRVVFDRCHVCMTKAREVDAYRENGGDMPGLLVTVERRDGT